MTTKALESSFATLDNVLLAMDFVLAQFEAGKETFANDPVMAPMYNSGWAKLDKYYRLTDESQPILQLLCSTHRINGIIYMRIGRGSGWRPSKTLVAALWDEYKPSGVTSII